MVKKLAIAAISALILTILPKMSFSSPLEKEIEKEILEIQSRGEPVTVKEILPAPIPREENGGFVFEQSMAIYDRFEKTHKEDKELIPYQGLKNWEELSNEEKQKVFHMFFHDSDFTQMFELFEKSLNMKCQFVDRNNYVPNIAGAHYPKLRSACRLISAKTFLYQEQKEYGKALDTIYLCTKLNRTFDTEPFALGAMVRIAIGNIWLEQLKSVTSDFTGDISILRKLLEEIGIEKTKEFVYLGLISDRAEELVTFEQIRKNKKGLDWEYSGIRPLEIKDWPLYVEKNRLVYLQIMKKLVSVSKLPYWQAKKRLEGIWKEIALLPEGCKLAENFLGYQVNFFKNVTNYKANLEEGEIALALKLYKAKYKSYPDSPTSLVPEFLSSLSVDPFSGKDYRYRKNGEGFILYSVGEDLRDNGGITRREALEKEGYDIVWRSKQ